MIEDFRFFKESSSSNSSAAVLLNPCFYTVLLYRLSNFFFRRRMNILAKIVWFINRVIFNVDIDYRATIEKGFMLVHGLGVVIGCDVKIGKKVKIYQGVTLGGCGKERMLEGEMITQPIIGDGCIIYTNTCIFGPVIIGDKKKIKACEVVTQDII